MISQMTPAGVSPASRARSTAASVWPAAHQHAAVPRRSGETWPGRSRSCGVVAGSIAAEHRRRAIGGRDPGAGLAARVDRARTSPSRAPRSYRHGERNLQRVEPLRRHRQADQAAAVRHHEVDDVRRDLLGRNREVAFVLPILVVDDDHEAAVADGGNRLLDGREQAATPPRDAERARGATYGNARLSS